MKNKNVPFSFFSFFFQGYWASEVGQLKVQAAADTILKIDPTINVESIADRFRPKQAIGAAVFCCVDLIESRAAIWRSVCKTCRFWTDGRMLGEVLRVLSAGDVFGWEYYPGAIVDVFCEVN